MAQAILIISQLGCPERYILQLKTDSILYDPPKKKAEAIQKQLKEIQYKDLHTLYDKLTGLNNYVPQCSVAPSQSEAIVFRVYSTMEDKDKLHCNRSMPITYADLPVLRGPWQTHSHTDWQLVEDLLNENKSFILTGAPGTG